MLYGIPCGGLVSLAAAFADAEARRTIPIIMLEFPLLFLFVGSLIVAPMWNRRADRLRSRVEQ